VKVNFKFDIIIYFGMILIESIANFLNQMLYQAPPRIKTSLLPPVELDKPGASYNPVYEEHQNELGEALAQEMKRLNDEKHLKKQLNFKKARGSRVWI
jgi:hypothetical protein